MKSVPHQEKFGNLYGLYKVQDGYSIKYHFTYKNIEYDATNYVLKHPGGREFFEKFRLNKQKDITDYFDSIHSNEAREILLGLPKIHSTTPEQYNKQYIKDSQFYQELREQIKDYEKPNLMIEIFLMILTTIWFLIGSDSQHMIISVFFLTISQIISIWTLHNQQHSRNNFIYKFGKIYAPLIAGISTNWWNRMHNLHHCFCNHKELDDQVINGIQTKIFKPFLILKIQLQSIINDKKSYLSLILLLVHWFIIFRQDIIIIQISSLLSGTFISIAINGKKSKNNEIVSYEGKMKESFIRHQLNTNQNYRLYDDITLFLLGGIQYKREHHLFPQVPMYYLPKIYQILKQKIHTKYELKYKSLY